MRLAKLTTKLLGSTSYKVQIIGADRVPETGGAILAANHLSVLDAFLLQGMAPRPIHFLMSQDVYDMWTVRRLGRRLNIIPVTAIDGGPEQKRAFREAADVLEAGGIVGLPTSARLTRGGKELDFDAALSGVREFASAPVIPAHLDRLMGPVYNFTRSRFQRRKPPYRPYPLMAAFGSPLSDDCTPAQVRRSVQELGTEAYMQRPLKHMILSRAFVRAARRSPFQFAMGDQRVSGLKYYQALAGSVAFARKLKELLDDRPRVGVLVPSSVGGALANLALHLMGRVPINLNYTASPDSIRSSATQCGLKHVLTSRAFLEKMPMEVPGEPIYLEDVRESVTKGDRLKALVLGMFCPVRKLERILGGSGERSPEDVAAIIFSSGSTGEPKGIILNHFNISHNIESALHVLITDKGDGMMGILPFFHSFGFTDTLWLPLTRYLGVVYHPNPLEAKLVGEMIHHYNPKLFVATPTFLQNYIRRCLPEELARLRYVITGAEKLPERIRTAFQSKFGPDPLEGYGTTECAPVVSVNAPDMYSPGFYYQGTKHGTIGPPVPGVSVKIKDPDTGAELGEDEAGLLFVKGPNIMQGYLHMPELTDEVLQDGWYNTGDIAKLDKHGFITITDRLSRFSKIAGEMVPHRTIEDKLHELLELTEQTLAVVGLPQDQKGERLIVLHTLDEEQLEKLLDKLNHCDLPNLWTPRPGNFYRVEELPVLGTGKLDLKGLKELAKSLDVES